MAPTEKEERMTASNPGRSPVAKKPSRDASAGECCAPGCCGSAIDRRDFVRTIGFGGAAMAAALDPVPALSSGEPCGGRTIGENEIRALNDPAWPVLRYYDQDHLARIALPLGGIGTGTVSLSGRGSLRDWEIMNRPAKGFVPATGETGPFFALYARAAGEPAQCRILEGPIEYFEYEGSHGSTAPNENYPRFRNCSFATSYPLGRVILSDPDVPAEIHLKAFNPLVPCDLEASGLPIAVLSYEVRNRTSKPIAAAVCGSIPNFVGIDGSETAKDWKGDTVYVGARNNRNEFRREPGATGLFLYSEGVRREAPQWGTMALVTTATEGISHRTTWSKEQWGSSILDFWDDFSNDGRLEERRAPGIDTPVASLSVSFDLPPNAQKKVTFLIAWHFPNRYSWTPRSEPPGDEDFIGNHYTGQYADAWDAARALAPRIGTLEEQTTSFVRSFCASSLPPEVKESALFNLSTLRTQTCFRTADGRFYGYEGCGNTKGCCHGSCTHVWNYEQATPFLFGALSMSMREVEFNHATSNEGMMSFRVNLPLSRGQEFGKAAADGQMGCIMKMYRDWQLSGDDATLKQLWPNVRKALEFCWVKGGWDGDRDGVMEGCQHNTMDVEYYGPNPQMGGWYLGALRSAEEMARYLGDADFSATCRELFEKGRDWMDTNLFNGEYYEQQVRPPRDKSDVFPALLVGMGASDPTHPDYQLASGCLVDQLVGQYMAHVCGLGYLLSQDNVRKTLASILKYNSRASLESHFNCMRTFALGDESALLMASYPKGRPENPFPYFTEVMTGFEYTAAVGMLYEGMTEAGVQCVREIRERYDGRKRNPFDEAECGHHYARAMASWAAVLAFSGFSHSAVTGALTFTSTAGKYFWSNGYAWGNCEIDAAPDQAMVRLAVSGGTLRFSRLVLRSFGDLPLEEGMQLRAGAEARFAVRRTSIRE
jgi:non-lysosomal glucosylceramidase